MTKKNSIPFAQSELFSLGVEVELQLIHPQTRDLYPLSIEVLSDSDKKSPHIKAELFQSMLEIDTPICKNAHEVEKSLIESGKELQKICQKYGAVLATNGTHPFADWQERLFYPSDRYDYLLKKNQYIARRLMIYGLHVHIGMKNGDHCIEMLNEFNYYTPHLLAISASSPFWVGKETGLASSRITVFEAHPAGGHPCQVKDWADFENIIEKLTVSKSITSFKDIWWDLRPSPTFGTLEIRICDGVPSMKRTSRLVAFIHLLARHIQKRLDQKGPRPHVPDWMNRENKWRASRRSLNAEVLVNDQGETKSLRQDILDLLEEMREDIKVCQYEDFMKEFKDHDLAKPSYMSQVETYNRTNNLQDVVDQLCEEFSKGLS